MKSISTKAAAEAALRELPSVLGVSVKEDVYGHPREVHLLIAPGPDPRHLAKDIRDLLEERLGVPVDQRVISIAQLGRPLAPAPSEGPMAKRAGADGAGPAGREREAQEPSSARLIFRGLESTVHGGHALVRVRLSWRGAEYEAEVPGLDTPQGRLRAGAVAALRAASLACEGRIRLELEAASLVRALDREYALIAAVAVSPLLGRRPLALAGAHPPEDEPETAGALAALKATNRVLTLALRPAGGPGRSPAAAS